MPKNETAEFFNDSEKKPDATNPDVMNKWIGVAEKGINLVETLVAMRQTKDAKTGGESSAYEKGLGQGQAIAQAQAPLPQMQTPSLATLNFKTGEAVKFLKTALGNINQDKTLKEYLETDIKELEESGMLNAIIEKFLNEYTEVIQ